MAERNPYIVGSFIGYDLEATEEQYGGQGGGVQWDQGSYRFEIVGQRQANTNNNKLLIVVDLLYQQGPDEPVALDKYKDKYTSLYYGFTEKELPFYNGFLHRVAWWQFWPELFPNPDPGTNQRHPMVEWFSRSPFGPGAIIETDVEEYEYQRRDKETNQLVKAMRVGARKEARIDLIEPSGFAKAVLKHVGVADWEAQDPPAGLASFNHIFTPEKPGTLPPVLALLKGNNKRGRGTMGAQPAAAS